MTKVDCDTIIMIFLQDLTVWMDAIISISNYLSHNTAKLAYAKGSL